MILQDILACIDATRDVLAMDISCGRTFDGAIVASMSGIRTLATLCASAVDQEATAFKSAVWPDEAQKESGHVA